VLETQVATSSDDAEEKNSGRMKLTSADLELQGDQMVGLRFTGLSIPQGATIANAYVQFQADEVHAESTSLTIEGEDVDDATTFSSINENISSRPRTFASVSWSPVPWTTVGAAGSDQRTPNLATIVQEIVDRPGWSSDQSMVLIVTGSGRRVPESYNGGQNGAPRLQVEYATGAQLPRVRYGSLVKRAQDGSLLNPIGFCPKSRQHVVFDVMQLAMTCIS